MRICIFGGSFNPIHVGHIALARAVITSGLADEVWLMVSPHNPLKPAGTLWDEDLRLRLTRQAVAGIEGIKASDFEFGLPRPSYSYATLCALRSTYPQHEFRLLIGADNWDIFDHWRNAGEILREFGIIIYPRPGFGLPNPDRTTVAAASDTADRPTLPTDNITILQAPTYDVSSTMIRQRMDRGESIDDLVPKAILRDLYSLSNHSQVLGKSGCPEP